MSRLSTHGRTECEDRARILKQNSQLKPVSSFKQHVKIGQRCWRLVLEPVKAKLCKNHSNHHQFYPWYLIRKFRPFGWWVMKKNANNSKLYTLLTAFFELPWIVPSFEPAPFAVLREAFQNGWIFRQDPNGLWPSFSEKHIVNFSQKKGFRSRDFPI